MSERTSNKAWIRAQGAAGGTLYLCCGSYGGFGVHRSEWGRRLILGWVSIGVVGYDVERLIAALAERLTEER